jgi:hypothetical protein
MSTQLSEECKLARETEVLIENLSIVTLLTTDLTLCDLGSNQSRHGGAFIPALRNSQWVLRTGNPGTKRSEPYSSAEI